MDHLDRKRLGNLSEKLAAHYLQEQGLIPISTNYRCPKGEIDLIMQDKACLVFVEVRSKTSQAMGCAEESIRRQKILRIKAVASYYLIQKGYEEWPNIRFDVVTIKWTASTPAINWISNAF